MKKLNLNYDFIHLSEKNEEEWREVNLPRNVLLVYVALRYEVFFLWVKKGKMKQHKLSCWCQNFGFSFFFQKFWGIF